MSADETLKTIEEVLLINFGYLRDEYLVTSALRQSMDKRIVFIFWGNLVMDFLHPSKHNVISKYTTKRIFCALRSTFDRTENNLLYWKIKKQVHYHLNGQFVEEWLSKNTSRIEADMELTKNGKLKVMLGFEKSKSDAGLVKL